MLQMHQKQRAPSPRSPDATSGLFGGSHSSVRGSAALLLHPSTCLLPLSASLLRNYFLGTDSEPRPK